MLGEGGDDAVLVAGRLPARHSHLGGGFFFHNTHLGWGRRLPVGLGRRCPRRTAA
ncbi:hypothetical protein IOD13_00415 [Brevibacterium casei]|nr:hypothetical protein [Brevibacterium casei]